MSEHIEDAGEQFAPPVGRASSRAVPPSPIGIQSLQGHPDLVAIAQNDPVLALKIKWLIDSAREADWAGARQALEHIGFSVRTHELEANADEEGVVQ